jgi:hypothetical protein
MTDLNTIDGLTGGRLGRQSAKAGAAHLRTGTAGWGPAYGVIEAPSERGL